MENIKEHIKEPEFWLSIGESALKIFLILLFAMIIIKLSRKIIDRLFVKQRHHRKISISERRENTLTKLLKSVVTYIVYFVAFIMILSTFGFDIMPLLAGAGVAGLAIGFGAQSLVKDIISGFFIIFEDQFSVGDYVDILGNEGTVEEIGLRTTKLKSYTGEQQIIPNGNITQVTNYSIHNGLAIVDINLSYEADVEQAEKLIEMILGDLPGRYKEVLAKPRIEGIEALELSHVVIRIIAETLPNHQVTISRVIRKEIKEKLNSNGITVHHT